MSLQVAIDMPSVASHGLAVNGRVDRRLPENCRTLKECSVPQWQGTSVPSIQQQATPPNVS